MNQYTTAEQRIITASRSADELKALFACNLPVNLLVRVIRLPPAIRDRISRSAFPEAAAAIFLRRTWRVVMTETLIHLRYDREIQKLSFSRALAMFSPNYGASLRAAQSRDQSLTDLYNSLAPLP